MIGVKTVLNHNSTMCIQNFVAENCINSSYNSFPFTKLIAELQHFCHYLITVIYNNNMMLKVIVKNAK